MRGTKYNLKFKVGDKIEKDFNNIEKKDIMKNIKDCCLYDLGINITPSNGTVYNLSKRPNKCNQIIRNFFSLEKN